MKRLIILYGILASGVASCSVMTAQGLVLFANVGPGINAPLSRPNGFFGAEFTAQLQLADGTNIGDPVPFLANGLFHGGNRTIDGVAGGSVVDLRVAVSNPGGSMTGEIYLFTVTVTLGGGGAPHAPPAALVGLRSGGVLVPEYVWTQPLTESDRVICGLVRPGTSSVQEVDDCHCDGIPFPVHLAPLRTPVPCGQQTNGGIGMSFESDGSLKLRWPIDRSLVQSTEPGGRSRPVASDRIESGLQVKVVTSSRPQFFFWLE